MRPFHREDRCASAYSCVGWGRRFDDEAGWGLVEVMFAVAILLLVTLAIASLLYALVTQSSNTNNKEVAQNIATSLLQQERNGAGVNTQAFPPLGYPTSQGTAPSWCVGGNAACPTITPVTQLVSNTTYAIYTTGGWCAQLQPSGTTPGIWQNTPSGTNTSDWLGPNGSAYSSYTQYAGYFFYVKVAWGANSSVSTSAAASAIPSATSVIVGGLITNSGGDAAVAPLKGPIDSCPVGVMS
jgi:type II secretory pathway pseudopilin PulG